MTRLEFTADRTGERCDQFLARTVPELTRSGAQKLLEDGAVECGGEPVKKNRKTIPGEVYIVALPAPAPVEALPQNIPLDVAYEDEDVIVVNKPVGMVVHPAAGHPDGTLVNALLYHCGNSLSGINGKLRPGIVHRIDRDTSGLIIAAKNDGAHLSLAGQLEDHSLYREYHAIAVGGFREDGGTVDAPIARRPADRKRMAVDRERGKRAVTHWEVLERYSGYTYLKCRLETGRTHQIRVHLACLGCPLVGDFLYGEEVPELPERFALHSAEIQLEQPVTGEAVRLQSPLPPELEALL